MLDDPEDTKVYNYKFDIGSVCYWEVVPEMHIEDYTLINFKTLTASNVVATLNSGSDITNIDDERTWTVGDEEVYEFNVTTDATLYITVMAYDEDPEFSFRITLYDTTPEPEELIIVDEGDPYIAYPVKAANSKVSGESPPTNYKE